MSNAPKELVKATLIVWYDPGKCGVSAHASDILGFVRDDDAHAHMKDSEIVENYQEDDDWDATEANEALEKFFHIHDELEDDEDPESDSCR